MGTVLYLGARALVAFLQALPLNWVARIGRAGGAVFYCVDIRHRRVALQNLKLCFEKSELEIKALARENFRRIGENFCCAVKTAGMEADEIRRCVEIVGAEKVENQFSTESARSLVVAIGHFGNFELFARAAQLYRGYQAATTYRALREPALNRLLQSLRAKSGCRFYERRSEAGTLKTAMAEQRIMLGLLADQHAGDKGLWLPFFGRECSTSAAPAVLALRYGCPLRTAICYRTGLGRWRIEVGEEIPTHDQGIARSTAAITLDINRAFEAAVRRDPANWFWVHNRWKPPGSRFPSPKPRVQSPRSGSSEAIASGRESGG
jgi:KDO2-lipid IV(A) lauroyltransferase